MVRYYTDMITFFMVLLVLTCGYFFGKFTCEFSVSKKYGIWITLLIFIALNLFHSTIDGSLITENNYSGFILAIGHEIIRQPVLYAFFFGIMSPFILSRKKKILLAILSVTGVWLLGMFIGKYFIQQSLEHLDGISIYMYAFFAGDILHHIIDYIKHKKDIAHKH